MRDKDMKKNQKSTPKSPKGDFFVFELFSRFLFEIIFTSNLTGFQTLLGLKFRRLKVPFRGFRGFLPFCHVL